MGALALVISIGGVGYAAIPRADGVIDGCYNDRSGVLRVIDTETDPPGSCTRGETAISWNQQGPKGDPGDPAPAVEAATSSQVTSTYLQPGQTRKLRSTCPSGRSATGGSAAAYGGGVTIVHDYPVTDPEPPRDTVGWEAEFVNNASGERFISTYVTCLR